MEKEFTIKFYKEIAGQKPKFQLEKFSGWNKKEAFKEGRQELIRWLRLDENGNNEDEIIELIESVQNGLNNYCYDNYQVFFKVFSKKCKK